MSLRRLARTAVVLVVLGILVAGAPGRAHHDGTITPVDARVRETVTIPENNYTAYTFSVSTADVIRYDIRVVSGTEIDVYIVPPDGLSDYVSDTSPEFRLFARLENARNVTGTFPPPEGILAVIVDNTDLVTGAAMPLGPVVVSVDISREAGTTPIQVFVAIGFLAFGIALIIGVTVVVLRRRRLTAAPARPAVPGPYESPAKPSPPKEP